MITFKKKIDYFLFFLIICALIAQRQSVGLVNQRSEVQIFLEAHQTQKQSGAVEACLAHNQEVDGSKPSSAIFNKPKPPWPNG